MAEPRSIRERERQLAVRAKAEEATRQKRRAATTKRGGQVLETYSPDTITGALYEGAARGIGGLSRLFGSSERAATQRGNDAVENLKMLTEGLVGPEETERSVRRIAGGRGGAEDYLMAGLTLAPVPGAVRRTAGRAAKRVARGARSLAARAADTRVGKYLTEARPVAEAFATKPAVSRSIPRERVFSVTPEETPGAASQHRADILGSDFAARQQYGRAAPWTRKTPEGDAYDVMYAAQGIPQRPTEEAAGAYLNSRGVMENSPVNVTQVDVGGGVSPDMLERIRATENLRGLFDAQEAMAGNMPILDEAGGELLYRMPSQPTLGQMVATSRATSAPSAPTGMTATSQGGLLMPFDSIPAAEVPAVSSMLDELSRIYPEAEVLPARNVGFYDPAFGKWGEEGIEATTPYSGEATMQTLGMLANAPAEAGMALASSPEVRSMMQGKIARDTGVPGVREDLQNTRRFFAEADWQNALDLIRRGVSPAAALAALGYSTSALARPSED